MLESGLVVHAHGMNLHAATTVDGRDRKRLERVCKYLLRPPFALDAVHLLPDGRVRLDCLANAASSAAQPPRPLPRPGLTALPPLRSVAAVHHQLDLGCDGVILHGSTPAELRPVVEAYRPR